MAEVWLQVLYSVNLGFAEPIIFIILAFLLHAALEKRESGTLSQRWNRKTFFYVIFLCIPVFILQLVLLLLGPKFNIEEMSRTRKKTARFFMSTSLVNNMNICTYPLVSTIILGLLYVLLIGYIIYIGTRMLSFVINKGLRMRVYFLSLSVILFLPIRVLLLGFSVLPHAGNLAYEVLVFFAFLVLLFCNMAGICMLVYLPVADSQALRYVEQIVGEMNNDMPYDDYFYDSLIVSQSHQDTSRNSDGIDQAWFHIIPHHDQGRTSCAGWNRGRGGDPALLHPFKLFRRQCLLHTGKLRPRYS